MSKRPITVDDLNRINYVSDPQVSPDGSEFLFSSKVFEKGKYVNHLWTVNSAGALKQWTQGAESTGGGRWMPHQDAILFTSSRIKPATQFFLMPTNGGEAYPISSLPEGSIGGYEISPDGKYIAFTFRPTAHEFTEEASNKRKEENGSIPPLEIDDIWYRLDGDGYFGNQRYEMYLLDVADKSYRKLYAGCPVGGYSFDWSPNSDSLIVAHSAEEHPMRVPPNDQLYIVNLDGNVKQLSGLPAGEKGGVKWSPDGSKIAYFGDVDLKDPWGVRNTKVYVVGVEGGEPDCLTCHTDYCFGTMTLSDVGSGDSPSLFWSFDGTGLFSQIGWHGEIHPCYIGLDHTVKLLDESAGFITLGSVAKDCTTAAGIKGSPTSAPELVKLHLLPQSALATQLTHLNTPLMDELELATPEEHWVPSTDGVKVQTWVLRPSGLKEGDHAPVVIEVHGGPHTQYGATFFHEFQLLVAQGYVVVYSNPRGSKGYGEEWCAAIRGDWGHKDWDDVKSVSEWARSLANVDPERIGIMGGSYGGYMTNWAIGHSKMYKAAITDRCVSNMVSMAGSSDFPINADSYFGGKAWGTLEEIEPLWRQSPIAYFDGVTTPTLIIHSEGDLRCNIEQGEQVFHALQMQGVPSRFVRYPSTTSHGLSRNGPADLRVHRLNEIVAWWAKYL